jgi:hypothetical protein
MRKRLSKERHHAPGRTQQGRPAVARLRREVATLIANGVTDAELQRAREADIEEIRQALTRLGFEDSRTELLGEGALFADDPDAYLKELARGGDVTTDLAQGPPGPGWRARATFSSYRRQGRARTHRDSLLLGAA